MNELKSKFPEIKKTLEYLQAYSVAKTAEFLNSPESRVLRIKRRFGEEIKKENYTDRQQEIVDTFFDCDESVDLTATTLGAAKTYIRDTLWMLQDTRQIMAERVGAKDIYNYLDDSDFDIDDFDIDDVEIDYLDSILPTRHDYKIIDVLVKKPERYIFTSAVCGASVNEPFWNNLLAYANHIGAQVHVAPITYGMQKEIDPILKPYQCTNRMNYNDEISFASELNISPTRQNPIGQFKSYTQERWTAIAHPRIALESVANRKYDTSKQLITTGSVTHPEYMSRSTGRLAEHHHSYGALILEHNGGGKIWCRHLLSTGDGDFYDLDQYVCDGKVTGFNRVKAITWGDIHYPEIDPDVEYGCFLKKTGNMLDTLNPQYQFFHDIADMGAASPHNSKSFFRMYDMWKDGKGSVENDIRKTGQFLHDTKRRDCVSVVVSSNHDKFFERWLDSRSWSNDFLNAKFGSYWFSRRLDKKDNLGAKFDIEFDLFETVMKETAGGLIDDIKFLREDESYMVDEIEYGLHGHFGANGSRGSMNAQRHLGPKANSGHSHAAHIVDGAYRTGTSSKIDMGYNSGLSSWNHSHIVTYANDKRAIVTMMGDQWKMST